MSLSPSSIVADGVSSSRVTATLSFPLPGQTVVFSSTDSGIRFGPTIDNLNGTYTATLTSSTTAGTPTITATSSWMGQQISGSASLTQTPGPAKNMTLSVEPGSIVADGTSYAVATATVTDAYGNPVSTDAVAFSSTDPLEEVVGVASGGNGTYRALIRSSTTPGEAVITATDTTANLSVSSELSQTEGSTLNQTAAGSLLSLVSARVDVPVHARVHDGSLAHRDRGAGRLQAAGRLPRSRVSFHHASHRDRRERGMRFDIAPVRNRPNNRSHP